jgi:lipopolysaccharide export system protein LptA
MVQKNQKRRLILCAALLMAVLPLSAQQASGQTDSLVRLLNARSLEQVEMDGRMARKAIDPTFLHNGTYLSCDTALWHVDEKLINCFGNVQLLQGESVLTSDKLDYLIDDNLAQFRGSVVELRNQRDNVLRTRILDYNTQDSLAVFSNGASMISSDGQIIESDEGTYANNRSMFSFSGHVNMFTDSVFVRTERLLYDSNTERADFLSEIDFWKDGNMLSAGNGWYERKIELFFFQQRVHGLGETQESWSDSLYYYRRPNDLLMLGRVQVQDQSRKVAAMGDRLHYVDSLTRVTLEKRASAALWDDGGAQPDTTYLGAERFIYWTQPRCEVDTVEVALAQKRRNEMLEDPIAAYRRRAAEDAAARRAEAERDDPLMQARNAALNRSNLGDSPVKPANDDTGLEPPASLRSDTESPSFSGPDSTSFAGPDSPSFAGPDSTSFAGPDSTSFAVRDSTSFAGLTGESPDSLALADTLAIADTLVVPPPPDTTKIGFLLATKDIRIFRKDMQVRCDSLRYCDLDSIARLYVDPIVWNEGRRQYNSDSLFVLLRNEKMERANLLSNAFIHTEESDGYFDQIKSTDVIAYFNDSTALCRFDALGGVTALLYLEENDAIATVNKTESKMMMATFDGEGNVDHVYNYDNPKSDAYPVVQLPAAEHRLRGFNWQPDLRPKDKFDVTAMVVRDSERAAYEARPQADFPQTELYFPGHMKEVYKALEDAKEKRNRRDSPVKPANDDMEPSVADTTSFAVRDSSSFAGPDSTSFAVRDTTSFAGLTGESPADTTYMSDRELKKAMRIARRDARWAELDQRDADKATRKEARKAARQARRDAREAAHQARQAAIDQAKLQKYIERYQKKKERHEGRKQKSEPAGERPPGIEAGGELPAAPERE